MRAARLRRAVTRKERIRPGANECPGAIRPGLAPPWLNPNTDTFRRELPALEFFLPVPCDFLGAQMRLTNDNIFSYLEGRGLGATRGAAIESDQAALAAGSLGRALSLTPPDHPQALLRSR